MAELIIYIFALPVMFFGITYIFWKLRQKANPALPKERAQQKERTHEISKLWFLLAFPAMILLLGSDAGNNLSIVPMFASGELSLWSWQGLAVGCALASAPLGYAASRNGLYWLPCSVVIVLSGFLTLLSVGTDFSARSAGAKSYQATTQGLISERSALLSNLESCRLERWCDSQAKESRIAEINRKLSSTPAAVDPMETPNGVIFAQVIGWLRAFGVPFLVSALGNVLGSMRRKPKPAAQVEQKLPKNVTSMGDFKKKVGNRLAKLSKLAKKPFQSFKTFRTVGKNRNETGKVKAKTGTKKGQGGTKRRVCTRDEERKLKAAILKFRTEHGREPKRKELRELTGIHAQKIADFYQRIESIKEHTA